MSGFEVTSVELLATGRQVRGVADEIRGDLAALSAVMDGLCGGGAWRGRAACGFAAGWADWREGARQVLDALDAIGRLLTATGHDYAAAESASVLRPVA